LIKIWTKGVGKKYKTKFAGFGAGYVGSKKKDFKKEV
jgi:hypothetical protein